MLHNKHHRWLKYAVLCSVVFFVFLGLETFVNAEGFETEYPYVVTVYNEQNGLPTGEANTILQTKDGHIWIGSYGGLIRYDGSDFVIPAKKELLIPIPFVLCLKILREGYGLEPMI